jgi:hypothetical protein
MKHCSFLLITCVLFYTTAFAKTDKANIVIFLAVDYRIPFELNYPVKRDLKVPWRRNLLPLGAKHFWTQKLLRK